MPKLYVVNCTKQFQIIYYRIRFTLPEFQSVVRKTTEAPMQSPRIVPGHQINLAGEQPLDVVQSLVEWLCQRHGATLEMDVSRMANRKYPFVLNIDQPVKVETIRRVLNHNDGIMIEDGRARREAAAVQAGAATIDSIRPLVDTPPSFAEIAIENQAKEDEESAKLPAIDEGYRIETHVENVPDKVRAKREKRAGRR